MANEYDEFYEEDDDDLDEETLQVLDQAEKQRAVAISASQALPAASNSHRAAIVTLKPLPHPQRQASINARLPQASQQQRAPSARPIQQQQINRALPPSQQHQKQQYLPPQQQSIKTYPSNQYGNAAAGPSTSTYARRVVKPVYRDDFPNVDIDESGNRYKPRNSSVHALSTTNASVNAVNGAAVRAELDAEKEELKRKLAALQASLEQERKERFNKDGEVSYLRQTREKLAKEHEIALQEQIQKVLPLQEKISNLESILNQENAKHSSALIFQKQELESKYRNVAANIKNASARKQHLQQQQQSQNNARSSQVGTAAVQSSPRKSFKAQKGFQNSFFEPMTSTQRVDNGGRLPSSPSEGRAGPIQRIPSPASRDKGKQREIEPSSEMDYNDLPELQREAFDLAYEDAKDNGDDEVVQSNALSSIRQEITSFLFDHIPHEPSHTTLSLFSIVNPDFPSDFDISIHREICQRLFHCFGHRSEPSQNDKQQITLFLWEILIVLLDFVNFYARQDGFRSQAVIALDLIQDLCQRYATLALSGESNPAEYEAITGRIFHSIITCIKNERVRSKLLDLPPTQPQATAVVRTRSTAPTPRSRQARNEAEKARFEREVENLLCSVLHLVQFLALRPDPTRSAHLDAFLRETNSLAFLMDARRRPLVHLESMFLVALLSGQQILFRSLLSTPFRDELTDDRNLPTSTSANRTQQLAFVEQTAGFLSYRIGNTVQSQACQQLALIALSNLVVVHADGTPLLSRSPSLVQRLIMRIAQDAAILYDSVSVPPANLDLEILLRTVEASMRLLHHLILSQDGLKSLSIHLSERPFGRDYFISGVGRLACTEVPQWIQTASSISQLDQLANLGFELLEDVLSPDEVDDLYSLCRNEDDEEDGSSDAKPQQVDDIDEEEAMAAQNIDAMEL